MNRAKTKFRTNMPGPWQPIFAWKPIKIKGKWYWLQKVYKRKKNRLIVSIEDLSTSAKTYYEYGTIFDVLQDS